MRRAIGVAWLLVACLDVALASAESVVPARLAPLFDASHDEVVRQTVVPSPEQKVGEVRLVRRGSYDVVQTLLYTKVLSRVVAEIRKKELAGWPDGPGHDESLRYVEALESVRRTIWNRMPRDSKTADRRQKLWIEFVLGERTAAVAIGAFEMEDGIDDAGGGVRVRTREPLVVLEPSRAYVHRNMRLIAADSFHVEEAALGAVLGSLRLLQDPANAGVQ
jgi:hypothetical protein